MTTALSRCRIRLACDVALATREKVLDALTSEMAQLPRGVVAQVEIGLFNNGAIIDSFTGIESISFEIRPTINKAAIAYLSKTVEAASLTPCTLEQWTAGTGYHALILLSETETDLPAGDSSQTYWFAVGATITAGPITIGTGELKLNEDGIGSTGGTGVYYTTAQADARYMRRTPSNGSFRTDANGQHLQLWDPDLEQWRSLIIHAGALALGPGEAE